MVDPDYDMYDKLTLCIMFMINICSTEFPQRKMDNRASGVQTNPERGKTDVGLGVRRPSRKHRQKAMRNEAPGDPLCYCEKWIEGSEDEQCVIGD